jgi:hypothetical protein
MEEWLDREKIKPKISEWLASDAPRLLLNIEDSIELEDITNWVEELTEFNKAVAYLHTDSEVTRFGLLEKIVSGFGKEKFPQFTALYDGIMTFDPHVTITQTLGADNKTFTASFTENAQNATVVFPDPESVKHYDCERKIEDFLERFLADLSANKFGQQDLIVCRINVGRKKNLSFDDLESDFKVWFTKRFFRKIEAIGVRIIVLCESNSNELPSVFDYSQKIKLENLARADILPTVEKYLPNDKKDLFCRTVVDEDDKISYKVFKFKLEREYYSG